VGLAVVWIFLSLPPETQITPLSIEILGALAGVFLAISLSELIKELDRRRAAYELFRELLVEIQVVENELLKGKLNPIPMPLCSSIMNDGKIREIGKKFRDKIVTAYLMMNLFNQHRLHEYREQALDAIRDLVRKEKQTNDIDAIVNGGDDPEDR
jgi:hypothetical protein